jgi:hypothetical protein
LYPTAPAQAKLDAESAKRRALFNSLQELKGNIRVCFATGRHQSIFCGPFVSFHSGSCSI